MADSQITALSDGGAPQAADEFVVARGAANAKIAGAQLPGFEFDYEEITADVTVTGTSSGAATDVIDGNAVTYDGSTRVKIEFECSGAGDTGGSFNLIIELFDGATSLGIIAQVDTVNGGILPVRRTRFLTPSAASHTYHIKAWKASGSPVIHAASTYLPAWYRITKA